MRKRLFAAALCACLLIQSAAAAAGAPAVEAASAVLMEKETGQVLFASDAHHKLEPASVTKVMTLLLVMEALDAGQLQKEELVTVTLQNDTLKVDGNMAIAWSGSLEFTVERSGKSLIGSAASGEGLVNVYRGTGKVLLAPVLDGSV